MGAQADMFQQPARMFEMIDRIHNKTGFLTDDRILITDNHCSFGIPACIAQRYLFEFPIHHEDIPSVKVHIHH